MAVTNPVLARLREKRQTLIDSMQHLLETVETEERDLVDAERQILDETRASITALNAQIEPLADFEALRDAHAETGSHLRPTVPARGDADPTPLGAATRQHKYPSAGHFVVDYLRATGQRTAQGEIPRDPDARQRVESSLGRPLTGEERAVAHQTTTGLPGLLPEPIVGEILTDLDESRPFVTSVGVQPLDQIPGKTYSRPIVTQHSQVGLQATEKTELASRALVIGSVEFDKRTFGGVINVSRQSIDWTSPEAWNTLITDLQMVYGETTEDWAAGIMGAGVPVAHAVEIETADAAEVDAWIAALYEAAVIAATANNTKRARARRLPNTIWTSVDMWGSLGAVLDAAKITATNSPGEATPTAFSGSLLEVPRIVAPGLPAGTMIVGNSRLFEFREERIGLLSAIEPAVLGIEVAYGGYAAAGFLDATAFAKITVEA